MAAVSLHQRLVTFLVEVVIAGGRAACEHASCTRLGILSLVLTDPVGRTLGANVFQKSLDYESYKQRI